MSRGSTRPHRCSATLNVRRALRGDPAHWLPGDRGDVLVVGVVVQDRGAVVLGRGGDEQIDHSRGAMLAHLREARLGAPGQSCRPYARAGALINSIPLDI